MENENLQPVTGGKRKSKKGKRKMNLWAKAAGEYYHEHQNEVKSFSDVLKSPEFKEYYRTKYGKGTKKAPAKKFSKTLSKPKKMLRWAEETSEKEEVVVEESQEKEKEKEKEEVAPKKGKQSKKEVSYFYGGENAVLKE